MPIVPIEFRVVDMSVADYTSVILTPKMSLCKGNMV